MVDRIYLYWPMTLRPPDSTDNVEVLQHGALGKEQARGVAALTVENDCDDEDGGGGRQDDVMSGR
jgi:hypothetical protein